MTNPFNCGRINTIIFKGVFIMKKVMFAIAFVFCVLSFSEKSYAYCNHVWILSLSNSEEPTCIEDGYYWYDCDECGDSKTVTREKTGIHSWTEWEADGYLCCEGKYERYCEYCAKYETKYRAGDGNHLWSSWQTYTIPTCTKQGVDYRYCLNCSFEENKYNPANPNNHSWSGWYYFSMPTALDSGEMHRECFECLKVEVQQCDKLDAKIKLSAKSKTLKRGKKYTLKLKSYTYGDEIKSFKSSNKKVATVTKKGKITAKKKGTAKITVTMKSGCKATCKIKVK